MDGNHYYSEKPYCLRSEIEGLSVKIGRKKNISFDSGMKLKRVFLDRAQ
jgi:hypothetical protein